MLLDLVSPWCAAVEATGSLAARRAFRARHDALLEALRRQRAPQLEALPLATDPAAMRRIADRAGAPALHQQLRDLQHQAARQGADGVDGIALLAGDNTGDSVEPLPLADGWVALFLDRIDDELSLAVAFARGAAAVTRWRAADSDSVLRRLAGTRWDRWEAAREVPLREWLYTEALGLELARALVPGTPPHQLLGVTRTAHGRLRQSEKSLRALLAADFDQSGIGLILRWLTPTATPSMRTVGGTILAPMAGRYLATTMLLRRVARVGLRAAIRMGA